jgi:hypothetical protein
VLPTKFGQDEFEDTKEVIRIRISKKNQKKQDNTISKRKSTKGQTTIYKTYTKDKTKDRVTRTPLKTGKQFLLH